MGKLFVLVLLAASLDICSTRPSQKGKKSGCFPMKKMPNFTMVSFNADVTLTCPKGKNITFLKHCEPLKPGKIKVSGRFLTLRKFAMMDIGRYTCQFTDANGHVQQFHWVLHFKKKTTPQYRVKPVKTNVVIYCQSFVGQNIFYSAKNNGTQHLSPVPNSRLNKNITSKEYKLLDLTIHDTGFYYCGNSATGKYYLVLHLVVTGLPKVTTSGKLVVKRGDDVQLKCVYTASEKIAWFKQGVLVSENKQVKLVDLANNTQSLTLNLRNVSEADSGRYRCGVYLNKTVFSKDSVDLEVFAFFSEVGIYGSRNMYSTIVILCQAHGANVTYSLLRKPMDNKDQHTFQAVPENLYQKFKVPGIFVFQFANSATEGYYKCRATSQGVSIEREFPNPLWLSNT
ncbi:hemicentin-1-like [Dendronephthya gigantea]|uniref:hemicentin-1-like n=1 Tax=Dendronephthya gigantea TaxID=151771 RepID=UPI00106AABC1|nr:hemicentin-1-like [Dendronephthya gigantea]